VKDSEPLVGIEPTTRRLRSNGATRVRRGKTFGAFRRTRTDDRPLTKWVLLPAELGRRKGKPSGDGESVERAVGIEPTLMGWKPSAYADRPGPQKENLVETEGNRTLIACSASAASSRWTTAPSLIGFLFASVITLEESASHRASRCTLGSRGSTSTARRTSIGAGGGS
jgi:hypothetical protein